MSGGAEVQGVGHVVVLIRAPGENGRGIEQRLIFAPQYWKDARGVVVLSFEAAVASVVQQSEAALAQPAAGGDGDGR